jgi:hypothetical protein
MQAQQARKRVGKARGEFEAVPRPTRWAERIRLAERMSISSIDIIKVGGILSEIFFHGVK